MAEYFYYFGFLYIVHYVIALYDIITFGEIQKKIDEMLPKGITPENALAERERAIKELKKVTRKSIPWFIRLVICYSWVISGLYISDEPAIFLFLIIFAVSYYLGALIYAVTFMIKNRNEFIDIFVKDAKQGIEYVTTRMPKMKAFNIIDRMIRIAIVSYLMYIHFI